MKHWYRTLPVKIICFVLCIISLGVTALTVIAAIIFAEEQFYNQPKAYFIEEYTSNNVYSDAYDIIWKAMNDGKDDIEMRYSPDSTNLRFQVFAPDGEVISRNTKVVLPKAYSKWEFSRYYIMRSDGDGRYFVDGVSSKPVLEDEEYYTFLAYVDENMAVDDIYAIITQIIDIAYSFRYTIYPIGISALILALICFIWLMCASARRPRSDGLHPGVLNHVPFDLLLAVIVTLFVFAILATDGFYYYSDFWTVVCIIAVTVVAANIGLGLCMSISARIKQKTLFTNTIIWMCCKLLRKVLKWTLRLICKILIGIGKSLKKLVSLIACIPMVWRTALTVFGITLIEFIVILGCWYETDNLLLWWFAEKLIIVPLAIYAALFLRKLQKGGIALAKGDLSYQVDTGAMFGDFKRHGENLNSIADGMARAVDERLQSERMKAELITNVSHDIKTPLTSIINYAGLIAEDACENDKHKEYAEVLVRKSEHLKRLLDDLVEVSKAANGNLDVVLIPCDAGILLTQAAGEFEQRCQAANLELITSQPDTPMRIMADSRRIWRVFENLMSNACKYSLTGSRVYLSLERAGSDAVFTFRNTSKTALNISPSELMERFVRGDASRSTEGNGLGLSIARSLTELQNGKMDITIDGDLFKVTLRFPMANNGDANG